MILINFLPAEQKQKIKWQFINRFILFYSALFVFLVFVFIVALFIMDYFLMLYTSDLKSQIENFNSSKLASQVNEIETKIKDTNKKIESVSILQKTSLHWSWVLQNIAANVPEGVTLASINSTDGIKITINGYAVKRDDLLLFESNLENSPYFSVVSLPFSDLTKRENATFNLQLTIKEGALQKNKD